MSRFRPTRASPPSKAINLPVHSSTTTSEISRSSAVSIPELIGLTPEDVDFLDSVIERAGLAATTFLTVFKAYNDVLHERGMDPQNEVVYYGKLLKLGTLKGRNWGDKWNLIKLQQGYDASHGHANVRATTRDPPPRANTGPPRLAHRLNVMNHDDDAFTLHSHLEDSTTDRTETDGGGETDTSADVPHHQLTPRQVPRRTPSPGTAIASGRNALGLQDPHSLADRLPSVPRRGSIPQVDTRNIHAWESEASDMTETQAGSPSTTPPSYGAAVRDSEGHRPSSYIPPRNGWSKPKAERPVSAPTIAPSAQARQAVALARERRGSNINEEEAWEKIKMARDEEEADRFREDRLVERCWDVWREGFRWILTTNEQIGRARDTLVVRLALQRWRARTEAHLDLYERVTILANKRRLRSALSAWRTKFKHSRQIHWRNDMRAKMKSVREKREGKLRKDAWAKWRQSYRSHLSGLHYSERLVLRSFQRWKDRLTAIDRLEDAADEFTRRRELRIREECWMRWRKAADIGDAEKTVIERVGLRIMGNAMDAWRRRVHENHTADAFYDIVLKKKIIRSWKTARDRIRGMEKKATKHLIRQDDVLLRAVTRVWKARERGRLIDRIKTVRLLKDVWSVWKARRQQQKDNEELALAFSTRAGLQTAFSALQKWQQARASHKNAHAFAVHYDSAQLRYKMLHTWRVELRVNLDMAKQARKAEKRFLVRRTWGIWMSKLRERKRERKVVEFERKKLQTSFNVWLDKARQQQLRKLAEKEIKYRVAQRIVKDALSRWTNHTINIKLREWKTSEDREKALMRSAFKKWQGVCKRHYEEFSLMESYQDVKREENIRRMFHRWLTAARSARHRRLTLQRKEDELRLSLIAVTWDKWRDRFNDEKLRPIEYSVLIQTQKNIMFRAFGVWHSKTKSLPAIRFHATNTKAKFWEIWRGAMPRALQAKSAREMEKRNVLGKALEKWSEAYQTKIALKAVARARYLRLPTAAPRGRHVIPAPRSTPPPLPIPSASRNVFPRKPVRAASPTETEASEAGPSQVSPVPAAPKAFRGRSGIASLLSTKPRSEAASPPRPRFLTRNSRAPSPARSKSSYGGGRRDPSPVRSTRPPSKSSFGARDTSPTRVSVAPSSATGGEAGRSRLWLELREVQRRSRPPTERTRSRSREPP
ncbi:hypothetical protein PLICRDRAFT_698940 [Plicaturopsis crispa FD-325 SS-3]|nr:hypothetical protein PLICRDRAFT_698940 [Plicaturopsis crispa FD-325 SS-3]